jgi:hypothetical protein
MLSKKILRLKKQIENFENKYIDKLFEKKMFFLIEEIEKQNKEICSLRKELKDLKNICDKKSLEDKTNINSLASVIESVENYKEICSNDVKTLASAITEIYGILNHMLGGALFKKKEDIIEEDLCYDDVELCFDEYIDVDGVKKKKKVYH